MVSGNVIATVSKSVPLRAAAGNAPQGAGHGDRKRPAFRHVIGRLAMLVLVATIGVCAQIEALWIPATPASSVTLADETLNKDLVAKQIRQVDDKLAGLNRSQLHDLDLVSYDHA